MKKSMAIFAGVVVACASYAEVVVLEGVNGSTVTTGNLLDEFNEVGGTTNVQEIAGLSIIARSGAENQDINVTASSLGIDSDGSADDSDAFEYGESMVVNFNKEISITRFDFNSFDEEDVFVLTIDGVETKVSASDLSNKSRDYFDTNIVIPAFADVEFGVEGTNSVVGLDAIELNVVGAQNSPRPESASTNVQAAIQNDDFQSAQVN